MKDTELLERNWGRGLVHESGHALMAVLENIDCRGICYNKTSNKFCAITMLPARPAYEKKHYMFLAASSASENIIYGNYDEDGARADKLAFEDAAAPLFQDTLDEAQAKVLCSKRQLELLVSKLKAKCLQANLNVEAFPEEIGMDGSTDKFGVLMTKQELEDAVRSR
jgi:hypothetical protein